MGLIVEHDLPKSTDAPALARDAVRGLEGYVPADMAADAALLISELVTNGVKYGGDGKLELHLDASPERLRAEIVDQGSGFSPELREDRALSLADEGGWGLHVVETVADDWGVFEGSTHVWFELRARA